MAKFATKGARPAVRAPVATTAQTVTYEGGAAFSRDAKSDLYLLAITNLVLSDTFYEKSGERDARMRDLVRQVTQDDPEWVQAFVPYLRNVMQMRSASVVVAAEYVAAGGPNGRGVVANACQRADEPGEMVAYWQSRYGRAIPQPVKRGVADAARRLFNERAALRYDGGGRPWRLGDIIELTHPKPTAPWQSDLFKHLIDRRHRDTAPPETLHLLSQRYVLESIAVEHRRAHMRNSPDAVAAGMGSWEWLSGWLSDGQGMDAKAWEFLIESGGMGYMATLRNLRNFDEAEINPRIAALVEAMLTDPVAVARSRQFPIRFLSAWKAVAGMRWASALETALNLSLANVPELPGRTLVMVDLSGSMVERYYMREYHPGFGNRHPGLLPWEYAATFGAALALRAERADLYGYSDISHTGKGASRIDVRPGGSVLRVVEQIGQCPSFGGGTETVQIAAQLVKANGPYDRLIVLTDEQAFGADNRLYGEIDQYAKRTMTFNMNGYRQAWLPSDGRHYAFGGLTDAAFTAIAEIERSKSVSWEKLFADAPHAA